MKVLLLGSNGQLGTDIQKAVTVAASDISLHAFTRANLNVEDLENIRTVLAKHDFDVLINCTSYHKTDEVEFNGSKAVTINAHAVERMAKACQEKRAKFFHISTDYVFSGNKTEPYTEEDCPAPLNVYGATKYLGEVLAQQSCKNTYILRVASLFGVAGASGKGGNFVETMIRLAREKGEVRVVNDLTMSPTATSWIAHSIFGLLVKTAPPGIYHVVNSGAATWFELASKAIELSGVVASVVPATSNDYPTVAKRPAYSVLDNQKLSNVIGDIPGWGEVMKSYMADKGYI